MTGGLATTVFLLVANALFVALEFALIASRRSKLELLAGEGDRRARLAVASTRNLNVGLAAAQLGITVASLGLGFVAEPTFSHLITTTIGKVVTIPATALHSASFVAALVIVALLHMVIGEVVPKNLVLADPERSLRWLAGPSRVYIWLCSPAVRLLNGAATLGIRAFGVEPQDEISQIPTAEELGFLVSASHDEGLLGEFEHELLAGALGIARRSVTEVMVPWSQVTAMSRSATRYELEDVLTTSGFTRLPIVDAQGSPMGFLHAKDLLDDADLPAAGMIPLGRLRRMIVLDESQTLQEVLLAMRWSHLHLGYVRDSTGEPRGLVTLEDVLEQLVGDIRDESDRN